MDADKRHLPAGPLPIDVFVHTGPAEWWQILAAPGPLAVLVGVLLATLISWRTLRQRTAADALSLSQKRESDAAALAQKGEADNRAEWWRRTQWALDHALGFDQTTKALGLFTLDVLAHSEPARKEELELFDIAWKSVAGPDENGDSDLEHASDEPPEYQILEAPAFDSETFLTSRADDAGEDEGSRQRGAVGAAFPAPRPSGLQPVEGRPRPTHRHCAAGRTLRPMAHHLTRNACLRGPLVTRVGFRPGAVAAYL